MLGGAAICAVVALGTFLVAQRGQPVDRHEDAMIVLATLAALQGMLWFGMTWWADLADEQA